MSRMAVLFHRLGPYHCARLSAAGRLGDITAIELSRHDRAYPWDSIEENSSFRRLTLSQDKDVLELAGDIINHKLKSALANIKPNVVAIPGWSDKASLSALSWCLSTRTPAIVMSESTAHDEPRKGWKESIKGRIVRLYSAGLCGGAQHAHYLSLLGLPPERTLLGYDVVDNAHFATGADAARADAFAMRQRLGLPESYFLAVNRFVEKKNLFQLILGYAAYRKRADGDPWKLILVGDGPLKTHVMDRVKQLDLVDDVLFPGLKQYKELPAYYGLAGAFVHASTTEQWGLVVNEAMATGLPVIVSERCGCVADLVESGRNGFTFDPYDVQGLAELMNRMAAKNCDRKGMGRASREIIHRWSPETFAENLWKAAEVALNVPRPRPALLDKTLLWVLANR